MSSNKASELLVELYPERDPKHWRSVDNCLKDIADGGVIHEKYVAAIALGLFDIGDAPSQKLVRRANKLPRRIGKAGRREIKELSLAAIKSVFDSNGYRALVANINRIGFNRVLDGNYDDIIDWADRRTGIVVNELSWQVKEFTPLTDPIDVSNIMTRLAARDKYWHNELFERDKQLGILIACSTGQMGFWEGVQALLKDHALPLPFQNEVDKVAGCLARFGEGQSINLDALPVLPSILHTEDTLNCPVLGYLTSRQCDGTKGEHVKEKMLGISGLSRQLLMEISYVRNES